MGGQFVFPVVKLQQIQLPTVSDINNNSMEKNKKALELGGCRLQLINSRGVELTLTTVIGMILVLIALLVLLQFYFAMKTAVGALPG